jgi:hypothetical protein
MNWFWLTAPDSATIPQAGHSSRNGGLNAA